MNDPWHAGRLRLRPELICALAWSSLRVRIFRTVLTLLTIATASAFLIYLLTQPSGSAATDRETRSLMMLLCLLVSAVGVLNTMLMSVAQRHREIGTLKCLGALDSFVLLSVVLESSFLGFAGGLLGAGLGLGASMLLGLVHHGDDVSSILDTSGLPWKIAAAVALGVVLATLGSAVPAFIASRLAPMEAMRGEK